MISIYRSAITYMIALLSLTACFSVEQELTFHSNETVTASGSVLFPPTTLQKINPDNKKLDICKGQGTRFIHDDKGATCSLDKTKQLDEALAGSLNIDFPPEFGDSSSSDLTYDIQQNKDGTIIVAFLIVDDVQAMQEEASKKSASELQELRAIMGDANFAYRVVAPRILSTNGTMLDAQTAEYRIPFVDFLDNPNILKRFEVHLKLDD